MNRTGRPASRTENRRGSSLVTTLLVITVLTIIVVAFSQSMSIERRTSQSYANIERAKLAAEAGVNAFIQTMLPVFESDNTIVVRNGNLTFAGRTDIQDGKIIYCPLFSYTNEISLNRNISTNNINALPSVTPSTSANSTYHFKDLRFDGSDVKVCFIDLPESHSRFAYFARDLAGYVNANLAGNTNSSGRHLRKTGIDPEEISLFSLFISPSNSDPENTEAKKIIDFRKQFGAFPTQDTLRQVIENNNALENLVVVGAEDDRPEFIPKGVGFPDNISGTRKRNLNEFVLTRDVIGLARFIEQAIPSFDSRKGGWDASNGDYVKTIAANIIDYADMDNDSTTGQDYIGSDSYPLVNEWFDLHNANWPTSPSQDGLYYVEVVIRSFVELWNTSNTTSSGKIRFIPDFKNQTIRVNGQQKKLDNNANPNPNYNEITVNIPPNGFTVLEVGNIRYTLPWGPTPPPTNATLPMPAPDPAINFALYWNGQLIDYARSGVGRANASTGISRAGGNINHWRGNASPPNNRNSGQFGDPRMNKYLNFQWVHHTYSGSDGRTTWGGRNSLPGLQNFEIRPSFWPQPQHDSAAGTTSPNSSTLPTNLIYPQNEAKKAVAFISNKGRFDTATELRFIFDPAQWRNINSNSPSPQSDAGGGMHFAIGRPEAPYFLLNNRSATRFLDIFSASDSRKTSGLININTATPEALRALIVGVNHSVDDEIMPENLRGDNLGPPTYRMTGDSNLVGESFVQSVIASRPFIAKSQLAQLKYGNMPFFGNPEQWNAPPTAWNHAAATHLFSQICDLTSFTSRNFELFVVGQTLDKNGKPVSTIRRSVVIFFKPKRNPQGLIVGVTPQILHVKEL